LNYWIFKSEPDEFGIDDLAAKTNQTARWDGIRNYQARNSLRDAVKASDQVFFYHSNTKRTGIVGIMEVVKPAYPDPAQFDANSKYYDQKSSLNDPRWFCVDVRLLEKFTELVPTKSLKSDPLAAEMSIFKQPRLSIAPVTRRQWLAVGRLR
jgi:predicted RNA-binding protein with PUA-like domain